MHLVIRPDRQQSNRSGLYMSFMDSQMSEAGREGLSALFFAATSLDAINRYQDACNEVSKYRWKILPISVAITLSFMIAHDVLASESSPKDASQAYGRATFVGPTVWTFSSGYHVTSDTDAQHARYVACEAGVTESATPPHHCTNPCKIALGSGIKWPYGSHRNV